MEWEGLELRTHPLSAIGVMERGVVRVEGVVISGVVSVVGVDKLGCVVSTSDCIGSNILTRDSYKQATPM